MTDAAKMARGAQVSRTRNLGFRLAQYLLLQAAIAALCILALRHPLSEPPSRYLAGAFTLADRGASRSVTLPAFVPSRVGMSDPAEFSTRFDWSKSGAGNASPDEAW